MESIEPGSSIGHYDIIEHLGRGVTANVYKVYDHAREDIIALKKLHPNREGLIGNRQLLHEARVGSLVSHHAVVAMYDFNADGSGVTLSMQYAEGESLDVCIEKGDIGEDEVSGIGEQLSDILVGLRNGGVIHRDAVPQNLIYNDGELKLCDFGSACTESESSAWRLPSLTLRYLWQYAPDSPGFMGSWRAFPLAYLLGAKPTYRVDEHAASLVIKELAGKVSSDNTRGFELEPSVGWQSVTPGSSS